MKKVILKINTLMSPDELERVNYDLKCQFDRDGFIVVDNSTEVIIFDDGKEEPDGR